MLSKIELPDTLVLPIFQIEPIADNSLLISTNGGLYKLELDLQARSVISAVKLHTGLKTAEVIYCIEHNKEHDIIAIGTIYKVLLIKDNEVDLIWKGVSKPSVRTIEIINDNKIFFGTRREGGWVYTNGESKKILAQKSYSASYIQTFNNDIFIASDSLYQSEAPFHGFTTVRSDFTPEHDILSFYVLDEHNLFIGTRNGLRHIFTNCFLPGEDVYSNIPHKISSTFKDTDGAINLGSERGKMYVTNEDRFELIEQNLLTASDVLTIFKRDDLLIAGSSFEGLLVGNKGGWHRYSSEDSLQDNTIRFIDKFNEKSIIAGGDSYVNILYFNEDDATLDSIESLTAIPEYSNFLYFKGILRINDHTLISSNEGLYKMKNNELKKCSIEGVANDHEVVGTIKSRRGFYLFTLDSGMHHVLIDDLGRFTIDSSFEHMRRKGPKSIQAVFQDSDSTIWIADYNSLWALNKDETFFQFDKADGYWIKPTNNLNFVEGHDSSILLTSQNGSLIINKDLLLSKIDQNCQADVFINNIEIIDLPNDNIEYSHDQNNLEFRIHIKDPLVNNSNFYSYQLEPLNSEWTSSKTGVINYSDLRPGSYDFHYKYSNQANLALVDTHSISFDIQNPIHKTTFAYLVYLLLSGLLLNRIYKYYQTIHNRELIIKQESELGKFKTNFLTQISHDFRTPLTVIKYAADQLTSNQKEHNIIHRNSDRLLFMVDQILHLNKYERNDLKPNLIQSDIMQYIRKLCAPFQDVARAQGKVFEISILPDPLIMDFDPSKLDRILFNLVSNALKFTNPGDKINFRVQKTENNLRITVSDTGIGIAKDELDKVFEIYHQTHSHQDSQGLGLGLALAKQFIKVLNGSIECESKKDKGTTFTIVLPIRNNAVYLETPQSFSSSYLQHVETTHAVAPANYTQSKPIILVAEDNHDLNYYISELLNKSYNVISTYNGEEAFQKSKEFLPDIILSDVMMPKMDGVEFCKMVKAHKMLDHIPFIFLTAKAGQDNIMEGLEQGAMGYITKPFDKEEILLRIKNLLHHKQRLQNKYQDEMGFAIPDVTTESQIQFLTVTQDFIRDHLKDKQLSVDELVKLHNTNHVSLNKKLKDLTGYTTAQYIRKLRLNHARHLLLTTKMTISDICYTIGLKDPSHFSKLFKVEFGITPTMART